MKQCKICGAQLEDDAKFCGSCGNKVEIVNQIDNSRQETTNSYSTNDYKQTNYGQANYGQMNYAQQNYGQGSYAQNYNQPNYNQNYGQVINTERGYYTVDYQPISMWGYFGYGLLFAIPVIGLVLIIVFSISAKNKNVKNFALSYLIVRIIIWVFYFILMASGVNIISDILRAI